MCCKKGYWLATVSSLAIVGAISGAGAADLPARMPVKAPVVAPAPAFSWTGFYIGIHGGGAWLDHKQTTDNVGIGVCGVPSGPADCTVDKFGGAFGGLAGYNFQSGRVVFGVEVDGTWLSLRGSKIFASAPVVDGALTIHSKVNWLATVRGRLGITMSPTLIYVTGGAAFGGIESGWFDSTSTALAIDKTKAGWVAGGGIRTRLRIQLARERRGSLSRPRQGYCVGHFLQHDLHHHLPPSRDDGARRRGAALVASAPPTCISVRGHRCVYDRVGSGPNLTLLHSVGLSTRAGWRFQIPLLARHFTVLSYDFRGLGESERGSEPLGVDTFVRDLEELLRQLGIARTALMGVSLGGFVAQEFALRNPGAMSSLVLVSTASRIHAGHAARRAERNQKIRMGGMSAAADHQLDSHFPAAFANASPDVMAWYRRHYLANDPMNYIEIMDDLGRFDSSARLATIACPTLVVAGGDDASSVAGREPLDSARTLNRLIAGSELAVIPGAFHYPQIDHADVFNARVLEFLTRTAPAPAH
jgi:pimeloyl-ACP methyl ester carboxylesterase/opacity protein-like surface antigen